MHTTAARRCRLLRLPVFLTALITLLGAGAARASHETIVIDGNLADLITAVNNNLGPASGGFTTTDPLGDTYTPTCAYVNGYDIRQTYVLIDFKDSMGDETPNDITLYAGWQV